jgi:hypothetical protein
MSLAVIEPVRPSYSNRVSCTLQIVGQSSISIPQQFLHNYCRSPSVTYFTFDSYSLITVVTATAADLRIVDNNRLSFCRRIIYIKVLELEIKHKHGGFNKKYWEGYCGMATVRVRIVILTVWITLSVCPFNCMAHTANNCRPQWEDKAGLGLSLLPAPNTYAFI